MARGLLSGLVVFLAFVTLVILAGVAPEKAVYAVLDFWQPILLALIAWAGGPRIAQYIAPGIAAAAGRVRGLFGGDYAPTSVQVGDNDDPVPEKPVVS